MGLRRAICSVPVTVQFNKLLHPIQLRPGTNDVHTLISNVVRDECGQLVLEKTADYIVDAGAYIGGTSAYFLSTYQVARVVALEPNPVSCRLAQKLLEPYGDCVTPFPHARALRQEPRLFRGEETGSCVSDKGTVEVATVTFQSFLERSPEGRMDILKLDMEGAEEELFVSQPEDWLPYVRHIIVETHGAEIERTVFGVLRNHGWHANRYSNLLYCSAPTAPVGRDESSQSTA